ncbi:MAG: ketoacyl-ACP synthase III [Bacteroidales bacterium]|nr:ketoacyl-ACP synthase III [Bacteroidales bacterium]
MKHSHIEHIACYYPHHVLSNADIQKEFPDFKIQEMTRLTGVSSRHVTARNETSVDMGAKAVERLFAEYNVDADEIGYLLFCSAGGDYITPPSACILHDRVDLPPHCGAMDFNQGCTGFLYGLSLADSLIGAGQTKKVLLVTSEAITKTLHPLDKGNRTIFGDAAAATLISASNSSLLSGDFIFGTDGSKHEHIIIREGRERNPLFDNDGKDFIDNLGNIRNHRNFYMNGSEVFNFTVSKAPELVDGLLSRFQMEFDDIDLFVFHQANRIILESIGRKLKIPESKLVIELKDTGNTVSSTIPVALKKLEQRGLLKRGMTLLLAGFGVGFSWGGTIIKY